MTARCTRAEESQRELQPAVPHCAGGGAGGALRGRRAPGDVRLRAGGDHRRRLPHRRPAPALRRGRAAGGALERNNFKMRFFIFRSKFRYWFWVWCQCSQTNNGVIWFGRGSEFWFSSPELLVKLTLLAGCRRAPAADQDHLGLRRQRRRRRRPPAAAVYAVRVAARRRRTGAGWHRHGARVQPADSRGYGLVGLIGVSV